jgi:hypothetical protein
VDIRTHRSRPEFPESEGSCRGQLGALRVVGAEVAGGVGATAGAAPDDPLVAPAVTPDDTFAEPPFEPVA